MKLKEKFGKFALSTQQSKEVKGGNFPVGSFRCFYNTPLHLGNYCFGTLASCLASGYHHCEAVPF